MDICFLPCIYLWQISQIHTCLCVVVEPGLVSTSPTFMGSSASQPGIRMAGLPIACHLLHHQHTLTNYTKRSIQNRNRMKNTTSITPTHRLKKQTTFNNTRYTKKQRHTPSHHYRTIYKYQLTTIHTAIVTKTPRKMKKIQHTTTYKHHRRNTSQTDSLHPGPTENK